MSKNLTYFVTCLVVLALVVEDVLLAQGCFGSGTGSGNGSASAVAGGLSCGGRGSGRVSGVEWC